MKRPDVRYDFSRSGHNHPDFFFPNTRRNFFFLDSRFYHYLAGIYPGKKPTANFIPVGFFLIIQ